jgi:predicted ATPase
VLSRIHDLVRDNSQFIIATHSPILMAYPKSTIYECTAQGIAKTEYEETEHYQVTRDFLINKERMLKILLEDEGD